MKPENLFITCGAAPALTAVFKALTVPGGEVLAIAPYFPEYKPFAESAGATFKVVPPDIPDFQDYDVRTKLPDDIRSFVPEGVQQVFWDYYHPDEEFYAVNLQQHPDWFAGLFDAATVLSTERG